MTVTVPYSQKQIFQGELIVVQEGKSVSTVLTIVIDLDVKKLTTYYLLPRGSDTN